MTQNTNADKCESFGQTALSLGSNVCSVIKDTHIPFVNFTAVCGSCQGCIFLFLLFWKGTLDLIWHVGCRGPVSLIVQRVHSQCPCLRKTKQVEKELFPLEKHQRDYFCSFKLLKSGLGQIKGGGWCSVVSSRLFHVPDL